MYTTGDPNLDKAVIEAGKSVLSGIFKSLWTKTVDNVPSWLKENISKKIHLDRKHSNILSLLNVDTT